MPIMLSVAAANSLSPGIGCAVYFFISIVPHCGFIQPSECYSVFFKSIFSEGYGLVWDCYDNYDCADYRWMANGFWGELIKVF